MFNAILNPMGSTAAIMLQFGLSAAFCLILASVIMSKNYRFRNNKQGYYAMITCCSLFLVLCTPLITGILAIPLAFIIAYFAKDNKTMLKLFLAKKYHQEIDNNIDGNKV
ncbi:hypothetical protein [Helicobacter trogontum]|uniref:Uncharacterized protein n=1 Tax=Helicobacter trogontum TaxID=50960 RepID=A0A4U8TH95_9HELI|nr:hypothetical protein [Helicobacter trogontum]MCI5786438.1 hypothetical protein [Helicobacter trogontum]MDY5185450.1 hypothetical protein [Helicobacter trogontum]TLD99355.1 hypothetical protein LS80_001540 [Helicobacter trogontum]